MTPWKTPNLADDGLCENTECRIRETDQCPIYRMMRRIAVPEVNNVINLWNTRWDMAGFQKRTYDGYRPSNVIWIDEWRRWLNLEAEVIQEDLNKVQEILLNILSQKTGTKKTAKIISFPKGNIA